MASANVLRDTLPRIPMWCSLLFIDRKKVLGILQFSPFRKNWVGPVKLCRARLKGTLTCPQKVPFYSTQSQLGHASIQTTIDRYGHLMPLKNYMGVGVRLDEKIFASKEGNNDNQCYK